MVPSDDDDDGILSVCDEISSLGFKDDDDDDVMHHQKKWRCHDDLAVTVNDAARPLVKTFSFWFWYLISRLTEWSDNYPIRNERLK